MTPNEKEARIKEVRNAVARIRKHPEYTAKLIEFTDNVIFAALDLEYEELDHVKDWLKLYDLQAQHVIYPIRMYPAVHPDYLVLSSNPFKEEFEEIKAFFEYARSIVNVHA